MKVEKEKVVDMLDNLFRTYDALCGTYAIQKIETVGYTYMAAAGLKDWYKFLKIYSFFHFILC